MFRRFSPSKATERLARCFTWMYFHATYSTALIFHLSKQHVAKKICSVAITAKQCVLSQVQPCVPSTYPLNMLFQLFVPILSHLTKQPYHQTCAIFVEIRLVFGCDYIKWVKIIQEEKGWLIQGVGAGFLFANSTAILTDAFPSHQRGMALGINQIEVAHDAHDLLDDRSG